MIGSRSCAQLSSQRSVSPNRWRTEWFSHQFTREQALTLLRDDVHAIRFDGGGGYVYAQTLDNMVVLHGANPAMEGNPAPASTVNEHGRPITDLIRDALRSSDNGVVAYCSESLKLTGTAALVLHAHRPW
jgi:hypothetical protein